MDGTLHRFDDRDWAAGGPHAPTHGVEPLLETGGVLVFPQLAFVLSDDERRFLDPAFADGKAKNISVRPRPGPARDELRGARGTAHDQAALLAMVLRFRTQAQALVDRLFPHYRGRLTLGNTSYRPMAVEGRVTSWRKDDTRLHVDAFPSNPTRGTRLLRVFTNLNPRGEPRRWRVGEPFEAFAPKFLPAIPKPVPGAAAVLRALRVTKARRSDYDHYMLHLHDRCKADLDYQREAPQLAVDFAPGTTWVVFSDQVLHAAMGGQFMMEQTFYLPPTALQHPASAPLATLERMLGRPLLD
jgi:hypothetical protein